MFKFCRLLNTFGGMCKLTKINNSVHKINNNVGQSVSFMCHLVVVLICLIGTHHETLVQYIVTDTTKFNTAVEL